MAKVIDFGLVAGCRHVAPKTWDFQRGLRSKDTLAFEHGHWFVDFPRKNGDFPWWCEFTSRHMCLTLKTWNMQAAKTLGFSSNLASPGVSWYHPFWYFNLFEMIRMRSIFQTHRRIFSGNFIWARKSPGSRGVLRLLRVDHFEKDLKPRHFSGKQEKAHIPISNMLPEHGRFQPQEPMIEIPFSEESLTGWWFGTWMDYDFPYREFHHPNWRTHIFQRSRYTTNQLKMGTQISVEKKVPREPRLASLKVPKVGRWMRWWPSWKGRNPHMSFTKVCCLGSNWLGPGRELVAKTVPVFNSKMFLFCNLDASISVINSSIPACKPLARGLPGSPPNRTYHIVSED